MGVDSFKNLYLTYFEEDHAHANECRKNLCSYIIKILETPITTDNRV